ncbi:MAG: hypothetical protein U1A27_10290 [Phycisphaerae bacterium]
MAGVHIRNCDKCGGGITADEIRARAAGLVHGQLLCVACVNALRSEYAAARSARDAAAQATTDERDEAPAGSVTATASSAEAAPTGESQTAASESVETADSNAAVAEATADAAPGGACDAEEPRAGRFRIFHGAMTPAGLAELGDAVDEWLCSGGGRPIEKLCTRVEALDDGARQLIVMVCLRPEAAGPISTEHSCDGHP